ncbi:hypothetical protein ABFS83_08G136700 [Erythranthe nasuta]
MANMKRFSAVIFMLVSVSVVSQLVYSRPIVGNTDDGLLCDGVDDCGRRSSTSSAPSFLEWGVSAAETTCDPIYGFLPCSTNLWGLLFLIVVYEILLSIGGQYVVNGSILFFQITGPGVFGGSLFQLLGTIPQVVMVLVSALSGTIAAAQQRATLGMGLVAGTTVMLLTLIWGSSVILGSSDLSQSSTTTVTTTTTDTSGTPKNSTPKGSGVVTDVETSYTARIMLISLIPFLVLVFALIFNSSTGKRVIILIALIVSVALLIAYIIYQIFQPWIQNRCFQFVVTKYGQDKLLTLITTNGKTDPTKILTLFNKINKNADATVSTAEVRGLLLGVKVDINDDKSTERDVGMIMASFDTSSDGVINQDEFTNGMTKLVSDLSNQTSTQITTTNGTTNSQGLISTSTSTSQTAPTNSWPNYLRAGFFVIFGILILCAFSEPLIRSVVDFSIAANFSTFSVSYLAIPFAMNYGVAIQSIASARQKTQISISLTLSSLYAGVYMNNIIGLIVFLAPVYARNLSTNVCAEVLLVLIICTVMSVFTSIYTTFPRWIGYVLVSLYPISLATVYILTTVLGWS